MADLTFRSDITVELVKHAASDADVIWAARVSTKGEQSLADLDADPAKSAGLINYLMRDRHGSPFEHYSMTFFVQAPIFVCREYLRHRIASYNEESGRYKVLEPDVLRPGPGAQARPGRQARLLRLRRRHAAAARHRRAETETACRPAYAAYESMLAAGVAREVARIVLPLTIYSSMYVTMNARALMNFLSLRKHSAEARFPSFPQREIEMVAER